MKFDKKPPSALKQRSFTEYIQLVQAVLPRMNRMLCLAS